MALNVLVVDDSSVMRGVIIKNLRLSGLPLGRIYEAANGEDGLQILETAWIDLALIDINMPGMSGKEMFERVRSDPATSDLPVVIISTESSGGRIENFLGQGAGFVHKPFSPAKLRQTVVRITGVPNGS